MEAIVKKLKRRLAEQTNNAAPTDTQPPTTYPRQTPAKPLRQRVVGRIVPVAPPAKPNSRGAVISKDGQRIVIFSSHGERCELEAFDAVGGRRIWRTQLALPGARRLEIFADGQAVRVIAPGAIRVETSDDDRKYPVTERSKVMAIEWATGKLLRSGTDRDVEWSSETLGGDSGDVSDYPIADPIDQHEGRERLLELDVRAAKLKIEAARLKQVQLQQADASGSEVAQAEIAIMPAEVDLQRAQTLLELHRKSRAGL